MRDLKANTELELIKQGDHDTLKSVYVNNRNRFINFAKNQGLTQEDAKDVFQNAIIALKENAVQGQIKNLNSSVSTYLFGIGKHMIRYQIRSNTRRKNVPFLTFEETKEKIDVNFSGEEVTKEQRLLQEGLKKLGPKCVEVIELFYLKGYVLDEIMQISDYKSKEVLRSQKSRCMSQLKEIIKHL